MKKIFFSKNKIFSKIFNFLILILITILILTTIGILIFSLTKIEKLFKPIDPLSLIKINIGDSSSNSSLLSNVKPFHIIVKKNLTSQSTNLLEKDILIEFYYFQKKI
jgi:hypothetical protein